jgi:hypothetical protein
MEVPPPPSVPPLPPDPPDSMETIKRKRKMTQADELLISDPALPSNQSSPTSADASKPKETPLREHFYSLRSLGPFIVFVQSTESGKSIHPMDFGKFLYNKKINNIINGSIKSEGKFRLAMEFSTASSANSFIKNIYIQSNSAFKAYIPTHNVTRMGLIRGVSTNISDEDIMAAISVSNPDVGEVLKIRRLNYKDRSSGKVEWKASGSIVVTFEGQSLPNNIYIYYNSFPVETYFYPTMQCFKCLRFGHTKTVCKSVEKCFKCGENHPANECFSEPTCFHCGGPHVSISLACPEYQRQKEIKQSMAFHNISYLQASKRHPQQKLSYANIVKKVVANPRPTPQRNVIVENSQQNI